uniref:Uncharacterized protein n=1 Tax=Rhodococcus qingshengii TaxID=334542 RepID=A0A221J3F6_RHOSG|nr:hypothetical protein [Rhodococcus qingshengii]
MGFGYFTTGALIDPDAPLFDDQQAAFIEKCLTRVLLGIFDS